MLDEHTPRSIERLLIGRGHEVRRAPGGAADVDILATADLDGSVVVTADRHFKANLTRNPARDSGRFKRAGLIKIEGEADKAIARLTRYVEVIERLYDSCQREEDKRLIIVIRKSTAWIDF